MANDFTGNPWVIDTPYAVIPSAGHIAGSNLRVTALTWTNQANAGDEMIATQINGKPVMDAKTNAPNTPIVLGNPQWIRGLLVPTLASGKLYVQHGK
jgi:hypothetical protein